MSKFLCALAVALASVAGSAGAATFTDIGLFHSPPRTVAYLPEATITSFGDGLVGDSSNFCATRDVPDRDKDSCEADLEIAFTNVVSNLTFVPSSWDPVDFVDVHIFGIGGLFLGNQSISLVNFILSDYPLIDLSGYGFITRLFFDDRSTGEGLNFGNFQFDEIAQVPPPGCEPSGYRPPKCDPYNPAVVPLPASLPLLLAGVAGFGFWRRKKA